MLLTQELWDFNMLGKMSGCYFKEPLLQHQLSSEWLMFWWYTGIQVSLQCGIEHVMKWITLATDLRHLWHNFRHVWLFWMIILSFYYLYETVCQSLFLLSMEIDRFFFHCPILFVLHLLPLYYLLDFYLLLLLWWFNLLLLNHI